MKHLYRKTHKQNDELIGIWETSHEGGLHHMGGCTLQFDHDGKGKWMSWGYGENEPFEYAEEIVWQRMGPNSIKIKRLSAEEFNTIKYKLSHHKGPYNVAYDQMYQTDFQIPESTLKGFWIIVGELYRKKQNQLQHGA